MKRQRGFFSFVIAMLSIPVVLIAGAIASSIEHNRSEIDAAGYRQLADLAQKSCASQALLQSRLTNGGRLLGRDATELALQLKRLADDERRERVRAEIAGAAPQAGCTLALATGVAPVAQVVLTSSVKP